MSKLEAKQELMDEVFKDIRVSMKRILELQELLVEGFQSLSDTERLSAVLERMARITKPKPS